MSKKPKNDPKRRKYRGEFMLLGVIWFMIWIGSTSDNWVKSALIFTLTFAALNFFSEFVPDKEKKDEVSEVRKQEGEGE